MFKTTTKTVALTNVRIPKLIIPSPYISSWKQRSIYHHHHHHHNIVSLFTQVNQQQQQQHFSSSAQPHMGTSASTNNNNNMTTAKHLPKPEVEKTDDEWRKILTPQQYEVCRRRGTERAFTGALWDNKASGIYKCVCCGTPLFNSNTKFDSGTGWPSFWSPYQPDALLELVDNEMPFMPRTEVICKSCHSHLGHVFDDGPRDKTGKRYCINSCCLKFEKGE